mmetsp:Transcript_11226/g.35828  ORF Transcript_11226/g.35828 Transcript_11226/m.35828 type:complete len:338 (-) Transcript_11226:1265-2278(-)
MEVAQLAALLRNIHEEHKALNPLQHLKFELHNPRERPPSVAIKGGHHPLHGLGAVARLLADEVLRNDVAIVVVVEHERQALSDLHWLELQKPIGTGLFQPEAEGRAGGRLLPLPRVAQAPLAHLLEACLSRRGGGRDWRSRSRVVARQNAVGQAGRDCRGHACGCPVGWGGSGLRRPWREGWHFWAASTRAERALNGRDARQRDGSGNVVPWWSNGASFCAVERRSRGGAGRPAIRGAYLVLQQCLGEKRPLRFVAQVTEGLPVLRGGVPVAKRFFDPVAQEGVGILPQRGWLGLEPNSVQNPLEVGILAGRPQALVVRLWLRYWFAVAVDIVFGMV